MVFLRSLDTTTSGLSLKIPVNRNPIATAKAIETAIEIAARNAKSA